MLDMFFCMFFSLCNCIQNWIDEHDEDDVIKHMITTDVMLK